MSFYKREELKDTENIVRGKQDPKFPVTVETGDESKVQTHFKEMCDINNIAKNIEATGTSEMVRSAQARYGDFTELMDVAENLGKAAAANQLFESMPAEIKKRAGHSVQGFFEMIQDPANKEFCQKWGIFEPDMAEPVSSGEMPIPPGSKKDGSPKKVKVSQTSTEE